jgi:tetratricopeptide (TPR) repeat protein
VRWPEVISLGFLDSHRVLLRVKESFVVVDCRTGRKIEEYPRGEYDLELGLAGGGRLRLWRDRHTDQVILSDLESGENLAQFEGYVPLGFMENGHANLGGLSADGRFGFWMHDERIVVVRLPLTFHHALADASTAVRLRPKSAEPLVLRARCYLERGRAAEAMADLHEALRLAPNLAEAHLVRGLAHAARGDNERALADLNEAVRLAADSAEAHLHRGHIRLRLGDHAAARADLERAAALDPTLAAP